MIDTKLLNDMLNKIPQDKKLVLVGIGSSRVLFDTYGCLTITMIQERNLPVEYHGLLSNPITALDISNIVSLIDKKYDKDKYIVIAIDACLAKDNGELEFREFGVSPGAGVNKVLPKVGDVSIVGKLDENIYTNVSLGLIYNMAKDTVDTIEEYLRIKEGDLIENK